MMIETTRDIRLKDIRPTAGVSEQQLELAQGMVRVNHLYRSALKVAVTQMEILDEEFCSLNDHSPSTTSNTESSRSTASRKSSSAAAMS